MLRLDFINVGDGDAILVREYRNRQAAYTMLVDCGRRDILPLRGSRRQTAARYLSLQGVKTIDLLVVTHLHHDHFGGIPLLQGIRVRRMLSAWLPGQQTARAMAHPLASDSASVIGMYKALAVFAETVRTLERGGCVCGRALSQAPQYLTPRLKMQITLADNALLHRQHEAFTAIENGEQLPEETLLPVSKERNNASLRVCLSYAGRRILLPGDALGQYWQNAPDALPCDILKVPHHGDEKSLTDRLMRKLRPSHAVITGLMGDASKHRPAQAAIDLLRRYAGRFSCLENDALGGLDAASHEAVVFTLRDSGRMRRRTPR